MDNAFEKGQLIIPGEEINSAFIYDPMVTELYDGVPYRVATPGEFIYWKKHQGMEAMTKGVQAYKQSKSKEVDAVHKIDQREAAFKLNPFGTGKKKDDGGKKDGA